jgi:hypothetical protein
LVEDGGFAKFDGTNWTTFNISNSGLCNNLVWRIAIDGNGSKWIGTWGGGITVYNENGIPVSVNENILKENSLKIFPNPANDYVNFKLLSKTNISFIEIINIQGILVNRQKIVNNQNTIDVSNLSVGMYIIKIHTDNGYIMKKIIKQ